VARAASLVGWLRPGSVRKLFHGTPAPLAIVPPDYEPPEGDESGPVVIAAGHDDSSHRAERFGRDLAARLGLDALSVQVGPEGVEPTSTSDGHPDRLAHGPTALALEQAGSDADTALFVCGTRGLAGWERWLLSSVSTDLAARADRPVLVIPPADVAMRAAGNG
jgi:nucleotide-binding universal stress UspA family protein